VKLYDKESCLAKDARKFMDGLDCGAKGVGEIAIFVPIALNADSLSRNSLRTSSGD
jgi:hypothetical protein